MQYNFKIHTSLTDEELAELTKTTEGLEASSELIIEAKIRVNTELPDDKVEALRLALDEVITAKLGPAEVILISQEH